MRLILFHPGAARIDCEECKQFVFNMETGEKETYRSGPQRELLPLARPPGTPTPCEKCPKESPEKAKQIELSERNWLAYDHYLQARAVGLLEHEKRDPIVRRNFALLDGLTQEIERRANAREFSEAFADVIRSARGYPC